jgi:hypothetical protein
MKIYLTLTIDVEPDCSYNWLYSDPLTFRGVETGIARRLHPLFKKYNIVPTYLINNVVLEDNASVAVLKSLDGDFELGTHLHPEFIEPRKEEFNYAGKKGKANCCYYEPDIEFEKIRNITGLFKKCFGYAPVSFRAGRFSAGANTIRSLIRLGYKVDTSVTPHVTWDDSTREKPVDFRTAPEQPYFIKEDTITEESGDGKLLQVPVSIIKSRASILQELKESRLGLKRPIRKFGPKWLRPYFSDYKDFLRITDYFTTHFKNSKAVVLNMMFHNVEVMPGLNPYTSDEKDCRKYLQLLEDFFVYCNQHDIQGIRLSDTYELFRE